MRKRSLFVAIALFLGVVGCEGAGDDRETSRSQNPGAREGATPIGEGAQAGPGGLVASGDGGAGSDSSSPPGAGNVDGAPNDASSTTPAPTPTSLPTANGTCPAFVQGSDITFAPAGIPARKARVWIGANAQTQDGPLVFYFHGTGMDPTDATGAIGAANVAEIVAMGGVLVAPYADPSTDYPWFASNGSAAQNDHLVIDEIVACAIQKVGIDTRRIHATGLSAGGMLVSDLSLSRSNYFASVSPHSGGFDEWSNIPVYAAPGTKMALLLFHGGVTDNWEDRIFYKATSEANADLILANGGFVATCDHGMGHTEPPASGRNAMWQFFKDHPFGAGAPYASGLPATFPTYCHLGK